MHDIKIPDQSDSKQAQRGAAHFEVSHMGHVDSPQPKAPSEMVKVKFNKFVQLVATHDFEEVLKQYGDDDVIVNTNLLTDLANAHEEAEPEGNKLPVIFLVGIILGIVITYIVIQF